VILTPEELKALTKRKRYGAQARQLKVMGIPHRLRSDGSPVVLEADMVVSSAPKTREPRLRF
jgi:hypothetical protein